MRNPRFVPITWSNFETDGGDLVPSRRRRWFENAIGAPYFNWSRNGFIFNEGGRFVTLTCTFYCPFRLYVGGWVLMWKKPHGLSFHRF